MQVFAAWWRRNDSWVAGCCIVVSWYLPRSVVRRPKVIAEVFQTLALKRTGLRLSGISPEKSCLNEIAAVIGNWRRLCWVRHCDYLDSISAALVGGWGTDATFGSLMLEEEQIPLLRA